MQAETIWGIVATVVGSIFAVIAPYIKAKANIYSAQANKYLALIKMITDAFDDGDITKEEFTAIVSYVKQIIPAKKQL